MDEDNSGFISLKELDEEAYHAITTFKQLMKRKYGNMAKAWRVGLDVDRSNQLDAKEFVGPFSESYHEHCPVQ